MFYVIMSAWFTKANQAKSGENFPPPPVLTTWNDLDISLSRPAYLNANLHPVIDYNGMLSLQYLLIICINVLSVFLSASQTHSLSKLALHWSTIKNSTAANHLSRTVDFVSFSFLCSHSVSTQHWNTVCCVFRNNPIQTWPLHYLALFIGKVSPHWQAMLSQGCNGCADTCSNVQQGERKEMKDVWNGLGLPKAQRANSIARHCTARHAGAVSHRNSSFRRWFRHF